jgi:murein DD-endopeptidase MepM/ murein hydrolase activator NlpD
MAKKKKFPIAKLIIIIMLLSFVLSAFLPLFAHAATENLSLHEKEKILNELNKKKSDLATKLKEARLKEAYASDKLKSINSKLQKAQNELQVNREYLLTNKDAWAKTKTRLGEINSNKTLLEGEAKQRILSIYKQNRLKMIDGLLNTTSATDYLDHIYYQKRIMKYDRKVLEALIDQSENISRYNTMLAAEAQKIELINNKLTGLQTVISKQQNAQKQVLTKVQGERRIYEEGERQLERESVKLMYKITELSGTKLDNPEATGDFRYPLQARITSPFGPRRHPIFGVRSMHSGIDLAAPRGTPIKSSEGGLVIYSGWYGGYGKVAIVDHSKGFSTLYAHMDRIAVKVGDRLRQGQTIGYEGATGYATGPHLHFELRSKGKPQNPVIYLKKS